MTQKVHSKKIEAIKKTAAATIITVINDTEIPVVATLGNGFLGFASSGVVQPGQSLELPCSPALWDVYVLFQGTSEITMRWYGAGLPEVYYHKAQGNVGIGSKIRVSDMPSP